MGIFVLIGGGENGRKGTKYETENIDREIVNLLSIKKEKKFLFLAHGNEYEYEYFKVIKKNFGKLGCQCDILSKKDVKDPIISQKKIKWADMIYIGGGNTLKMINFWKKNNFIEILNKVKNTNKILCGISAGAISFCRCGVSDSRKTFKNDSYIKVNGLNFLDILFCPSFEEKNNYVENVNKIIKKANSPMIALEKGTAIIIKNNKYRVIKSEKNKNIYKIVYNKHTRINYELNNTEERSIEEIIC